MVGHIKMVERTFVEVDLRRSTLWSKFII